MKRLTLTVLLLISITAVVFAGGSKEAASEDGVVTIKYAFWGNPDSIGVENDIIQEFEKTHPNIKIEPVVAGYGDYHSKLMTMISGGMAPDVMRIDSLYFQDFVALGATAALDEYVEKTGFDTSIYAKAAIQEATINGELHALPWGTAPIYMALNLDAFEKAGIELPSYDWTMEDFIEIIRQFNGAESGTYGYGFYINGNPFLSFIWAAGADLLTEDKSTYALDAPGAGKYIQAIADLYQQGYIPKDCLSTSTAEPLVRWFTAGSLAMMHTTAAEILTIQQVDDIRFEVYPFPGGDTVKNTTTIKSNEIAMSSSSKHKDAAWEFLSFLRGNEGERLYAAAKRIPPSLNNDPTLWPSYIDTTKYPKTIEQVTNLINENYGHQLPLRKGYSELDSNSVPIIQKILMGDITAEEGFKSFQAKAQEIIDRNN